MDWNPTENCSPDHLPFHPSLCNGGFWFLHACNHYSQSHSNWSLEANSFEKENMKEFELGIVKMDLESKAIQVQCTILIEINSMKKFKSTSVENRSLPNTYLLSNVLQYFFHSLTKLSNFLCHWMCKLEGYKWHKNGMLLLFSLSPISSSILSLFWVI